MRGLVDMNKESLNQRLEKLKLWFKNVKIKLPRKPDTTLNTPLPNKTPNPNKILVGVSAGFILGAIGSALILNMKLEKVQKEYENAKFLSSKLKSCQRLSQDYVKNTTDQSSVMSAINALPSSDIFASFYAELIKEQQQKPHHSRHNAQVNAPQTYTPPPQPAQQPPPLPPLNSLIGKNQQGNNQPGNGLQWIVPSAPPTPQVSVIVCSNNNVNCYAVSPDGTVYTNGYVEGNYKLVVTQNQVYWVKIHRKHSEN
jgi:hypothetical protein